MNDNVLNIIITSTLSILLLKYILLYSIKKKVLIPNEFKGGDGCHCSDNVLFPMCCACMYKDKFCGEM